MSEVKHGTMTEDRSGRHCHKHGEHGFLYSCSEYPEDLRKEIEDLGEKFRQECKDGSITIKINGRIIE